MENEKIVELREKLLINQNDYLTLERRIIDPMV